MIRAVLLGVLVPLLAGCSSLSYREPTEGPRARVRFGTDTTAITVLLAYDDAGCIANEQEWMRLRVGALVRSAPKRLEMPLWDHHENAAKEVYVSTSTPLNAMFVGGSYAIDSRAITTYSCGVPFTYAFEPGKDYQVAFAWLPQNCSVTVSEIVRQDEVHVLLTRAVFDNRLSNQNRGCRARFEKHR